MRSTAKCSFATRELGSASITARSSRAPSARSPFSPARSSRKASLRSSEPSSVTNSSTPLGLFGREALVPEELEDLLGAYLLELIHRAQGLGGLIAYAEQLEVAAEHLAVVYAYREVLEAELAEGARNHRGGLGVVHDVELPVAYDVDIRLIELAEAPALGPLAAPDLAYLVAAEGGRRGSRSSPRRISRAAR